MTRLRELYLCTICGNVVEVVKKGSAVLNCCGKAMEKQSGKSADLGHETHLPIVEKMQENIRVCVGETLHPMTEEHHIIFIEVLTDLKVYRLELPTDSQPIAEFSSVAQESLVSVRAYCNVHGLWEKEF